MPALVPYVRATDLYELASCPHRLTLDRRLSRLQRTEPDEATRMLAQAGRAWEDRIAADLGYPAPQYDPADFEDGARQTEDLMRTGVPGIYQPVLLRDRYLAIPDLVERSDRESSFLGPFHYVPGDVKSGLTPRSDQVLQVAFAGWLLTEVQLTRPDTGFLVLGDGRREDFRLDEIAHVLTAAKDRVVEIADGLEETTPFFDASCGACRWRGTCLPELLDTRDLSLVDGMTPTRRRVLQRENVNTVEDLVGLETAAWRERGLPALGLETLVRQARAFASGAIEVHRALEMPAPDEGALLLHVERDPLEGGVVILVAWCRPGAADAVVVAPVTDTDRARALSAIVDAVAATPARVFHFGAAVPRGLAQLCEAAQAAPEQQVGIEARLWDMAASLRRGTAFLPVRRYTLDEIVAALDGAPLPRPGDGAAPAFVLAEHLRRETPGPWREQLLQFGHDRLIQLGRLHAWMRAQKTRPPVRLR